MILNGVMAFILRYFIELVYDVVVKQLPRFQNLLLIVHDPDSHATYSFWARYKFYIRLD